MPLTGLLEPSDATCMACTTAAGRGRLGCVEAILLLLPPDEELPLSSLGVCWNRVVVCVSLSGFCSSLTLPCAGGLEEVISRPQRSYGLWFAGECYGQFVPLGKENG